MCLIDLFFMWVPLYLAYVAKFKKYLFYFILPLGVLNLSLGFILNSSWFLQWLIDGIHIVVLRIW